MRQSFEVPWKLSGLNEYTRACRANRYKGAAMKRTNQDIAALSIRAARLKPYDGPVRVSITWVEPNMRRDPDNIRFAAKFVLDALVEEGGAAERHAALRQGHKRQVPGQQEQP